MAFVLGHGFIFKSVHIWTEKGKTMRLLMYLPITFILGCTNFSSNIATIDSVAIQSREAQTSYIFALDKSSSDFNLIENIYGEIVDSLANNGYKLAETPIKANLVIEVSFNTPDHQGYGLIANHPNTQVRGPNDSVLLSRFPNGTSKNGCLMTVSGFDYNKYLNGENKQDALLWQTVGFKSSFKNDYARLCLSIFNASSNYFGRSYSGEVLIENDN